VQLGQGYRMSVEQWWSGDWAGVGWGGTGEKPATPRFSLGVYPDSSDSRVPRALLRL
jgi:hypothetical protein